MFNPFDPQNEPVLLGAIIALGGGLVGSFISRANAKLDARLQANIKLAEMRQAWLNSLRDAMVNTLAIAVGGGLSCGPTERFSLAATKVELLMNRRDPEYKRLHAALRMFLAPVDGMIANDEFVEVSQNVLKREWDVLKNEIRSVVN